MESKKQFWKKISYLKTLTQQLLGKLSLSKGKIYFAKICLNKSRNYVTTKVKFTKTSIKYFTKL